MRRSPIVLATAVLATLLASDAVQGVQPATRTPVLTTPHFAIYSDFDTNLNDALIAAGLARRGKKPELFHAGAETACFEKLTPPVRTAWDTAVDYYTKVVSPAEWNAKEQFNLRLQLAGFASEWKSGAELVGVERAMMTAAAPAYTACRWTAQDASNRRWIDDIKPRLAADEAKTAARLEQLYQTTWKTLPIIVDVVETVNWAGANTSFSDAGQGDILISNMPQGPSGFEVLFHESSHVLMQRSAPVQQALTKAAKAFEASEKPTDAKLPPDLWHLVLFYTTGEAVRPILDARGPAPYTPMLYEIFGRGSWAEYRQALETAWRPYVDGTQSLDQAAANLVAAIRKK
jgi:hypothetical protein